MKKKKVIKSQLAIFQFTRDLIFLYQKTLNEFGTLSCKFENYFLFFSSLCVIYNLTFNLFFFHLCNVFTKLLE